MMMVNQNKYIFEETFPRIILLFLFTYFFVTLIRFFPKFWTCYRNQISDARTRIKQTRTPEYNSKTHFRDGEYNGGENAK